MILFKYVIKEFEFILNLKISFITIFIQVQLLFLLERSKKIRRSRAIFILEIVIHTHFNSCLSSLFCGACNFSDRRRTLEELLINFLGSIKLNE